MISSGAPGNQANDAHGLSRLIDIIYQYIYFPDLSFRHRNNTRISFYFAQQNRTHFDLFYSGSLQPAHTVT